MVDCIYAVYASGSWVSWEGKKKVIFVSWFTHHLAQYVAQRVHIIRCFLTWIKVNPTLIWKFSGVASFL